MKGRRRMNPFAKQKNPNAKKPTREKSRHLLRKAPVQKRSHRENRRAMTTLMMTTPMSMMA